MRNIKRVFSRNSIVGLFQNSFSTSFSIVGCQQKHWFAVPNITCKTRNPIKDIFKRSCIGTIVLGKGDDDTICVSQQLF